MIRLQGWQPLGVFSSSSDKLLLLMVNDSNNQSKVVRYSGGEPLFSFTRSNDFPKCICENKNFQLIFVWTTQTAMQSTKVGHSDLGIRQSKGYFNQSELLQTAKVES